MNGRDGTTTFLPLDSRIGGQGRDDSLTVGQFLTRKQTRYIYKKVETGDIINTDMIEQEIEQERQLSMIDDTNRETNPYQELIFNNAEKVETLMTQMEQWSIMSNVINYVQHSRFHSMKHTLDIKAVNKYKHKTSIDNREFKELDFGTIPQKLQEEYMDMYEGIHSKIVSSNRFDENSNLSTMYLGRGDKGNQHKLKAEESFPISEHGYTSGTCWMVQIVNCYWTWVHASPSCQNHSICHASHSNLYQNLLQGLKEHKLEMVSVLVYYLFYQ